jgi:outer membrane protein OmpA-like peptidoglycan-associated protein
MACIAVFAILPLGACEHLSGDDTNNDIAVTSAGPAPVDTRLDTAPGVRPVPQFPVPNDRDLKVMTSKLSGGSVEIYDLDSGAAQGAPVPAVQPDYVGIPMATDPNVTVYPLDGYNDYPGELRPQPPSAFAGATQWPNSILPMGQANAMTPPPVSFGGDQPMAIEGGKLSSRAGNDISNIYFPYGSARLDGNDRSVLSNVAETAKFAPVDRVSVEGHASLRAQTNDPVKAKILNLKESTNRAVAVSQELIQKGVPAEKIKTVAWGDTKPSGGGEAEQRRVDIYTAGP